MDEKPVITVELQAYLGHPAPKNSVRIEGEPSEVKGGFNGDIVTCCAIVANSVPVVHRSVIQNR